MNYYTIDYDVNRPMANQMTVPMNSEYGIGVRIIKDNEPMNLEMGELSVNGISATSQVNGYNLYELSSGNDTGTNTLEVEASKLPIIDTTLTQSTRYTSPARGVKRIFPGYQSLSVFGIYDSPVWLTKDNLEVSFVDYGSSVRFDNTHYQYDVNLSSSGGDQYYYIFREIPLSIDVLSDKFWLNDHVGEFWLVGDTQTTVDSISVDWNYKVLNAVPVNRGTIVNCDATISMKYGYQYNFPLQVNVADKGYFERRLENEQTII